MRVVGALLGFVVLFVHVAIQSEDAARAGDSHAAADDDATGAWCAFALIAVLGCVVGRAWFTLVRDVIMLVAAAGLVDWMLDHPQITDTLCADNCDVRIPFLAVALIAVVYAAVDLVMLQPVFAALRARRLPRATVRRSGPRA